MKKVEIFDLETYPNFFLASFKCVKTNEYYEYEISDRKNEITQLRKHLGIKGLSLVGFNSIDFDYPLLHKSILSNNKNWTPNQLFELGQEIIYSEYSSIWENQVKIPQLDLFQIHNFSNKAKGTSLKWLEFAMRFDNVEDLPYKVGAFLTDEEKDVVVSYCRNDLDATHEFFNRSKKEIEIRQYYTNLEGINLMNASEPRIAKDVLGKYLSEDLGITYAELKKMRTERYHIDIKDIIFSDIEFKDPSNIEVLDYFKSIVWKNNDDGYSTKIEYKTEYKGITRVLGEGGIHSFHKPGIYQSDDEWIIYDIDWASYYPHLSFNNKLHPEHIPEEIFSEKYKGFYIERKLYLKSDPRNYVLKIILNSAYGLSKDRYSYLYDPKWQLSITINGQLLLMMLTERVLEHLSDAQVLFENTDGLALRMKRSEKHLADKACEEMAELFNTGIETQIYDKLIMRDVNNYLSVDLKGKTKFKGAYEIDRAYHKNHSKRIVAISAANYFINGIKPEQTIHTHLTTHTNEFVNYSFAKNYGIYDFCNGNKAIGDNRLTERIINGSTLTDIELGKVNRYYVSNDGNELIKKLPPLAKNSIAETEIQAKLGQTNIFSIINDTFQVEPKDRETSIEAGYKSTLFNKFVEKDEYNINYEYYIKESYKLINTIK